MNVADKLLVALYQRRDNTEFSSYSVSEMVGFLDLPKTHESDLAVDEALVCLARSGLISISAQIGYVTVERIKFSGEARARRLLDLMALQQPHDEQRNGGLYRREG